MQQTVKGVQSNNHSQTKQNGDLEKEVKLFRCKKKIQNTLSTDMQEVFTSLKIEIKKSNITYRLSSGLSFGYFFIGTGSNLIFPVPMKRTQTIILKITGKWCC